MMILAWSVGALALTASALAPPEDVASQRASQSRDEECEPESDLVFVPTHDAVRAAAWSSRARAAGGVAYVPHHDAVRARSGCRPDMGRAAWVAHHDAVRARALPRASMDPATGFVPRHDAVRAAAWPAPKTCMLPLLAHHDAVRAATVWRTPTVGAMAYVPHHDAVRAAAVWRTPTVGAMAYVPHHHAVRARWSMAGIGRAAAMARDAAEASVKPVSRLTPRRGSQLMHDRFNQVAGTVNDALHESVARVQCLVMAMHESFAPIEGRRAPPAVATVAMVDGASVAPRPGCTLPLATDVCVAAGLKPFVSPPAADEGELHASLAAILSERPRPVRARTLAQERARQALTRGVPLLLPGVALAMTILLIATLDVPRLQGHARDSPRTPPSSAGGGAAASLRRRRPRALSCRGDRCAPRALA
jgi:hypothetical protein